MVKRDHGVEDPTESRGRYRTLFESANIGILIMDRQGIADCNPKALEMFGYDNKKDIIGIAPWEFSPEVQPDGRPSKVKAQELTDPCTVGETRRFDWEFIRKDGTLFDVEVALNCIQFEGMTMVQAILHDITVRKRAEEENRQKTEDLALIKTLDDAVNRGDSLREILRLLARETKRIFSCHGATVYLLSEDREYLVMQTFSWPPETKSRVTKLIGMRIPSISIPVKAGCLYRKALQEGKPQLINDPETIQELMAEFTENKILKKLVPKIYSILGIHSVVNIPLVSKDGAIGLMDVSRKEPFTEFDLKRFETISRQLTSIIERRQAEEGLKSRTEELTTLLMISNILNTTLEMKPLLQTITDYATELIKIDSAAIYLLIEGEELLLGATTPPLEPQLPEIFLRVPRVDHPQVMKAVSTGLPVILSDTATADLTPAEREISQAWGLRSIFYFPIHVGKRAIGVLILGTTVKPRTFSEPEIDLCRTLANEVAISINNARLHENLKQYSRELKSQIRERKRAEEAMKKSKETAERYLDVAAELIITLDTKGNITLLNESGHRLLGYKNGELIGSNWFDTCVPRQVKKEAKNVFKKLMLGDVHNVATYENSVLTKTGEERIILWSNTLLRDDEDRIIEILSSGEDITERKKIEEEFENIFNLSPNMIGVITNEGKSLRINQSWERILGYTQEELLHMDWPKLVHPDDVDRTNKAVEKVFKGSSVVSYINRYKCKNGSYRSLEWQAVFAKEGILYTTARDITERKEAEEALRESEARIQALLNAPIDIMLLIDPAGIVLAINKTNAELFNKDIDEIIGNCIYDFFPPDIAESRKGRSDDVFNTGKPIHMEENVEEKIFSTNIYPVFDANGKVTAVAVYSKDITEIKMGENALKESEEKFSKLFQTSPNVLVISSLEDGRIIDMNDKGLDKLGYTREELIGKTSDEVSIIDPEDINKLLEMILKDGFYSGVELKARLKDGSEKYGMFHGQLIEIGGEPFLFQTIVDLTERKAMEEERETFFEISSDLMGIGDTNDFNLLKVNRTFLESLGYTEEEVLSKPIFEFLHPRMRGKGLPRIRDAMDKGETVIRIENQMVTRDGKAKWIAWTLNLERDRNRVYIAGRDITKRKKAEQERRRRLMRFRLDEGLTYLLKEKVADRSLEAIKDIVNVGLSVTVFSRTPEKAFRHSIAGDFHFQWLASRESEKALSPYVKEIERVIEELPRQEAILIDGIGYLTLKNGFDRTLEFIQEIRELAYINDLIIILTVNPDVMDKSQMRLLEIECEELVPLHETMLSEDLMDVLRLMVHQHDGNVSTTYMTLLHELDISRPTARKKITHLISLGYITEMRRGKTKTFVLTEKGKILFSK